MGDAPTVQPPFVFPDGTLRVLQRFQSLPLTTEKESVLARDINSTVEALQEQLSQLRSTLQQQAREKASEASSYLSPRANRLSKELRHEGFGLAEAAKRHPTAATGAVFGALALGAVIGLFLSGAVRDRD
jgi:hypothetical protein